MNNMHKHVKFTSETENNNCFSFLDINIMREKHQLITSLYTKPTFFGVFTRCESFIDDSYKKALVFTLLFRCFSSCSDFTKFHLEIEKLKNGYPSKEMDIHLVSLKCANALSYCTPRNNF